ncbi:MAG: rhodanese-like domain-containing protein [Thermoplasmatales archaeon]|nr:rhodanese-like domain-containing protein [Thermoplasmatales archaeon]
MQNNLIKKWATLGITTLMIGLVFGSAGNALIIGNKQVLDMPTNNGMFSHLDDGYTNLTVYEAWDLLNDTSNGIQIPIDVRTDGEWKNEHIDTPPPEHPQHYRLDLLQNETGLQEFMSLYAGEEIILYCKSGYRSFVATNILVDNNFTGTIYNMPGGILGWKAAGLPTHGNQPPDAPTITGSTEGEPGVEYEYIFNATDLDGEDIYYYIDWGDENYSGWIGPYPSGEDVIVNHTWDEIGIYNISAKAKDVYGDEGNWSEPLIVHIVAPQLNIGRITGGLLGVTAEINNTGTGNATNVVASIVLEGGIILVGQSISENLGTIEAGGTGVIFDIPVLGFGPVGITVTAGADSIEEVSKSAEGFVFIIFFIIK